MRTATAREAQPTASARRCDAPRSRSAMQTAAPSRANPRTISAPIPPAPPVTSAVLPLSCMIALRSPDDLVAPASIGAVGFGDELVDDPPHVARQERLLDHGAAALRNEV